MFSPENQVDSDFDKQKGIGGTTDTMPQRFNLHFNIKRGEFLHHFLANFSPKKFLFSIAFFRFILYNSLCSPLIGGRFARRCVGTGRRGGLKIHCQRWRAGSIPATGTKKPAQSVMFWAGSFCFAVFVSINCCVVNLCCFLLPQFCPLTAPKDALHICPSYPAASCGDGDREIRCWATIKSHDSFKGKTVEFA